MKETFFDKNEIESYSIKAYKDTKQSVINICGDIDESAREDVFIEFEENAVYTGNCFDGFLSR